MKKLFLAASLLLTLFTVGFISISENANAQSVAPYLYGPGDGIKGSYYGGTGFNSFIGTRIDSNINFGSEGTPGVNAWPYGLNGGNIFTVRWEGYIVPPLPGAYTFYLNRDDGERMWIDLNLNGQFESAELIMNNWNQVTTSDPEDESLPVSLIGGQPYAIKLEFLQSHCCVARAILSWQILATKVVVPQSSLYSEYPLPATPLIPPPPPVPPTLYLTSYGGRYSGQVGYPFNAFSGQTYGQFQNVTVIANGLTSAVQVPVTFSASSTPAGLSVPEFSNCSRVEGAAPACSANYSPTVTCIPTCYVDMRVPNLDSAPVGTYTIEITAKDESGTYPTAIAKMIFVLTVYPRVCPEGTYGSYPICQPVQPFTFVLTPGINIATYVNPGSALTQRIDGTKETGTTGPVNLTGEVHSVNANGTLGLPANNLTPIFDPNPCMLPTNYHLLAFCSNMTIQTSSSTPIGNYAVVIRGQAANPEGVGVLTRHFSVIPGSVVDYLKQQIDNTVAQIVGYLPCSSPQVTPSGVTCGDTTIPAPVLCTLPQVGVNGTCVTPPPPPTPCTAPLIGIEPDCTDPQPILDEIDRIKREILAIPCETTGEVRNPVSTECFNPVPPPPTVNCPPGTSPNFPGATVPNCTVTPPTVPCPPGTSGPGVPNCTPNPTNPTPAITKLTPEAGFSGASTQTLVVEGTGFIQTSKVLYNGVQRPTTYRSSSRLEASLISSNFSSNFNTVTVENPPVCTASCTSNPMIFPVIPPPFILSDANNDYVVDIAGVNISTPRTVKVTLPVASSPRTVSLSKSITPSAGLTVSPATPSCDIPALGTTCNINISFTGNQAGRYTVAFQTQGVSQTGNLTYVVNVAGPVGTYQVGEGCGSFDICFPDVAANTTSQLNTVAHNVKVKVLSGNPQAIVFDPVQYTVTQGTTTLTVSPFQVIFDRPSSVDPIGGCIVNPTFDNTCSVLKIRVIDPNARDFYTLTFTAISAEGVKKTFTVRVRVF